MNNITKKTHILDVKVPCGDYSLFMANRVDNSKKYNDLQIQLSKHKRHSLTIDTINIGCLGSWDPNNEGELKQIGIKKSKSKIVFQILVRKVVKQSYNIYLEHVKASMNDIFVVNFPFMSPLNQNIHFQVNSNVNIPCIINLFCVHITHKIVNNFTIRDCIIKS